MKRLLLPMLLALLGLGAGIGAGFMLRDTPDHAASTDCATAHGVENPCGTTDATATADDTHAAEGDAHGESAGDGEATHDYVKLNNQFIVPIVQSGKVSGLVVLSLSLEVKLGASEKVFALEPKLRDMFLQVLFDHANSGGFDGAFTDTNRLDVLRHALFEAARKELAATVSDVLITDIVRQDT